MKLARKSCNFTVKGEKGAFLTEHRRCVDSIIAYCMIMFTTAGYFLKKVTK